MLREAVFARRRRIEVVPREVRFPSSGSKDARGFFVLIFKELDVKNDGLSFTFLLPRATLYTSEFHFGNQLEKECYLWRKRKRESGA